MKAYQITLIILSLALIPELILVIKMFSDRSITAIKRSKLSLKSNLVIFSLGFGMTLAGIIFDLNILNYHAPIPYSDWEQITLADFKGLKRPFRTLNGNPRFAFISTEIKVKRSADEVEVQTYFHPSRSYTYNEDPVGGDNLLRHELYHLHITEYWARQLRKIISERKNDSTLSNLKDLESEIWSKEREMQFQYDYETHHSYLLKNQRKWQIEIDSLKLALDRFSNPKINLNSL